MSHSEVYQNYQVHTQYSYQCSLQCKSEILFPVLPFPQLTLSKHLYSRVCRVLKTSNQNPTFNNTCSISFCRPDQLVLQFRILKGFPCMLLDLIIFQDQNMAALACITDCTVIPTKKFSYCLM